MRARLLFSIALVAAAGAVAVAAAVPAGTPVTASMVLDTPDFAHGGVIVSEGAALNAGFPKFPMSSRYSRNFRNVAVGRANLITLESNAGLARSAIKPAAFMSTLITVVHAPTQRKAFLAGFQGALPKSVKARSTNLLRGRVIHVGDSAVDFLFRIQLQTGYIDLGEVWIQVGPALAMLVYATTGPGVTAGEAVQLAHTAATHMSLALEPAPASTAAPVITGLAQLGEHLTTTTGTWTGTKPEFRYQWLRCQIDLCTTIPAATASSYTVIAADQGSTLLVQVTATTRAGTATADSLMTPTVA